MNRKVIQITESGIFLCDDGTMWKRFTPHAKTSPCGFKEVVKPEWVQLENIPQPEESKINIEDFTRGELEMVMGVDEVKKQASPQGAPPATEYVKSFKRKSIFSGWFA